MNVKGEKERIRLVVYRRRLEAGAARPPMPIEGRIPNFESAEKAAERLRKIPGFMDAEVVKVNPDSPQRPVRRMVLEMGKKLVMPTPRLRRGFLLLDPDRIRNIGFASTIRGAFTVGRPVEPEDLPEVGFIVEGSVAAARDGGRLGKGEGYAELEYAILLETGRIRRDVEIATTVHPIQVYETLPRDPYDVSLTYIATSRELIRCTDFFRPPGILWDLISEEKLEEIPLLRRLMRK